MTTLFWLYAINLTLLILHEMDSTYWKEWDLFHLPGGQGGFLLIHIPLWLLSLFGLVQAWEQTSAGLIYSLVLSLTGIVAFGIHTYFLRTGHPEFRAPVSRGILWATLLTSLIQLAITIVALNKV